jgi:NADH dehydrogenase [ubiquinone] 1 alpha subcomplex assembly factor 6
MTALSYSGEQVRRYDHDRFMTAIFAPSAVREHLFALYAFNIELAKISEIVSEPLIGQMRLQWWRDTLDRLYVGETVAHGVARPLGEAIAATGIARAAFDPLIDAREFDLNGEPPTDFAALHTYAEGTGAPLLAIALQIAGASGPAAAEIARLAGTGWALTGLLRAVPFHARQRRTFLPADRLEEAGVHIGRLYDLKPEPGLADVVRKIGEHARGHFSNARTLVGKLRPQGRSPTLMIALGQLYLSDLARAGWNPFVLETRPERRFTVARLGFSALFGHY